MNLHSCTIEKPVQRWGHTATLLPNNAIFVFGGNGISKTGAISRLSEPILLNKNNWTKTYIPNTISPRMYHTANLIKDHVIIFGGRNSPKSLVKDTLKFNYKTNEFYSIISNHAPSPRFRHASTVVCQSKLLIHGGRRLENGQLVVDDELWLLENDQWKLLDYKLPPRIRFLFIL